MFGWYFEMRAAKKRQQMLALSLPSRRWQILRKDEMVNWALGSPTYHYEMIDALKIKLDQLRKDGPPNNEGLADIEAAVELFATWILNHPIHITTPLPVGARISHIKPHPLERGRNNAFIVDMFVLIRAITENGPYSSVLKAQINTLKFRIGHVYWIKNPSTEIIKEVLLENGFKEKDQGDGRMDLNPYVYDAVRALLDKVKIHA